ncbi:MAG: CoB--CoM heterodisulfide reductase iron-sulfur subunit B family protein [Promethearchaeota archaeon]
MVEYALFLGCMVPNRLPHLEFAFRRVLNHLESENLVHDIAGFGCCPEPIGFPGMDNITWLTLATRNLTVAEEQKLDVLTLCTGCFESLKTASEKLKHEPKLLEKVNKYLGKVGREYKGTVEVKHISQFFYEDIGLEKLKKNVTKPLNDIKVAAHYGCHLLRPSEILNFDDPHNPTKFDELIEATGAASVMYLRRDYCCGAGTKSLDGNVAAEMVMEKLRQIARAKADCMSVLCPFCFLQFDLGQEMASRAFKDSYDVPYEIPILYYPQLLGLSFGIDPEEFDFKRHRIAIKPLLEKIDAVTVPAV